MFEIRTVCAVVNLVLVAQRKANVNFYVSWCSVGKGLINGVKL